MLVDYKTPVLVGARQCKASPCGMPWLPHYRETYGQRPRSVRRSARSKSRVEMRNLAYIKIFTAGARACRAWPMERQCRGRSPYLPRVTTGGYPYTKPCWRSLINSVASVVARQCKASPCGMLWLPHYRETYGQRPRSVRRSARSKSRVEMRNPAYIKIFTAGARACRACHIIGRPTVIDLARSGDRRDQKAGLKCATRPTFSGKEPSPSK